MMQGRQLLPKEEKRRQSLPARGGKRVRQQNEKGGKSSKRAMSAQKGTLLFSNKKPMNKHSAGNKKDEKGKSESVSREEGHRSTDARKMGEVTRGGREVRIPTDSLKKVKTDSIVKRRKKVFFEEK